MASRATSTYWSCFLALVAARFEFLALAAVSLSPTLTTVLPPRRSALASPLRTEAMACSRSSERLSAIGSGSESLGGAVAGSPRLGVGAGAATPGAAMAVPSPEARATASSPTVVLRTWSSCDVVVGPCRTRGRRGDTAIGDVRPDRRGSRGEEQGFFRRRTLPAGHQAVPGPSGRPLPRPRLLGCAHERADAVTHHSRAGDDGAVRHRGPGRAAAPGPDPAPAADEGARRAVGDAHGLRHVHGRDLRRGRHPRPPRRRQCRATTSTASRPRSR